MKSNHSNSRLRTTMVVLLLFLIGVWFTDQERKAVADAKPVAVFDTESAASPVVAALPPWSEVQPANHGTNPIPDGFVQTAVYEDVARLAFPTPAAVGVGLRARVLLGEISGATGRHKNVRIEEVASIKKNRLLERRVMPADHVAVILHKRKTEAELRAALPEGLTVRRKLLTEGRYLIGFEAKDDAALPGALQKLQGMKLLVNAATADGYVFSASTGANRVCPDDPMFPQQWALQSPVENDAETQRDMDAPEAWALGTGSRSVAVAIIDSGMDYLHPDLAPNLWTNPGETGLDALGNDKATNGLDDDNSGFADDVHGHDFANDDNDAMDDFGHGTHVAGIIGAKGNNGIGISGVCWNVSLVPMKTLTNRGGGIWSDIVDAVNYASRLGLPIANCSFGAYGAAPLFVNSAFEQADNVLFCCAAGNGALRDSGAIVGDNIEEIPFMPAGLPAGHLISVAAHTADASANFLAEFSNYGRTAVDIAAPGVGILSTMPGGNYASKSGTSMACAFVSGTAALMRSKRVDAYPLQLRQMLQVCSKQRGHELTTSATGGRVWMWRSIVWAASGQRWRQLGADGSDVYQVGVSSEAKFWGTSGNGDPQGGPSMAALFREGADSGWLPFLGPDGSPGWVQGGAYIPIRMSDFGDPIVQVHAANGIPVLVTITGKLYFSNDTEEEPVIPSELPDIVRVCGNISGGYYAVGRNGNLWRLQDPLDAPPVLMALPPVREVFTNGENTFCTTFNGDVYGWGTNVAGALGSGDLIATVEPVLLPFWAGATEFQLGVTGTSMTFAIMGDGSVKACGESSVGLFGAPGITSSLTPRAIAGLTQIRSLEIGDCGTALDRRGRVFEWGAKGHYGGVDGVRVESVLQVSLSQPAMEIFVVGTTSLALMSDGTSVSWGEDVSGLRGLGHAEALYVNTPRHIPALDHAVSILGGAATTVLLADGVCFTIGAGPNYVATGIRTPLPPAPDGVELVVGGGSWPAVGGDFYRDAAGSVFGRGGLGWNPIPIATDVARMTKSTGIIFQETPFANRLNRFEKITGVSTDGNLISIGSAPVIGCPWANPSQIVQIADGGYGVLILREDGLLHTARPDGVSTGQTGSFNGRFLNPDGSPFWGPKLINCPLVADLPGLNYVLTQDGRVFRWPDNLPVTYPINDGDVSLAEVTIPQRFPGVVRSPIVKMVENLTLHADGSVTFFGATGPEFNFDIVGFLPDEGYVVSEFNDAVDLWAGNGRWFVKKADGTLWAWGNNAAGSLGDLTGMTDPTPTLAFGFSDEVSVAVTLGDWLAQYFSEDDLGSINISGDEADPDRDGLVNLVEYALGSDPTVPSDGDEDDAGLTCSFETVSSEALSADGNGNAPGELHFTVKLKRRAKRPGIEYRVEFSDDMVNWSASPTRLLKVLESEKTVIFRDVEPLSVTQRRWARLVIRKGN